MSTLHEECGVFGVFSQTRRPVAALTYYGLFALQHRGQESCGIVVGDDGLFRDHKDVGLVTDVFTHDVLAKMQEGSMAVGHCRYGTTGTLNRENAQPMLINHRKGAMAVCHNGNLTNAFDLRDELEQKGAIFHTTSDTEVIAYIIT
ncbi:MAG: amidophosphoribosyltransferase, partial [Evtepia sp.]